MFGSQRPICLGLKISPISQLGCGEPLSLGPSSWNLAWAFYLGFPGLMTEELTEPRKENRTVPGIVKGETQRKKSIDRQEEMPSGAKPLSWRLSPLFFPHTLQTSNLSLAPCLHRPGKCPMVGREMWVSSLLCGIMFPCGYHGLRREHGPFQKDPQTAQNWIPALPPASCVPKNITCISHLWRGEQSLVLLHVHWEND